MPRKTNIAAAAADAGADEVAPIEEVVSSIKGFDQNLQCRGFQFALGQAYEHDGDVEACVSGFHAIEGHPLEVFGYYPPATSRYAEVTQSGKLARHGEDSKVASARIVIATASGNRGKARGNPGNALFLVYRNPFSGVIEHVWAGIVGQSGIKPNTWYSLAADGVPREVDQ